MRTQTRIALVAAAAIAPSLVMLVRHRAPLELAHGALAALLVVGAATLLTPLSKPRSTLSRGTLGGFAALVPLLGAYFVGQLDAARHGANAAACFGVGAAYTAPLFALTLLAARSPLRSATEVALLAGLSGISASLLLDLHCTSRALSHLMLGHAGIGLAWALVYRAGAQAATTGSTSSSGRSNSSTISRMS